MFGYSTAYNNSEGAILSWIAPLRVPPDESRGEAEKRKKRVLNAPPLNKPLPKGYMLVSKISETLKLCVSASLSDYRL